MIKIFKTYGESTKLIAQYEEDAWINMIQPTEEECNFISQKFNIPLDFLLDPLDINERSRVEIEDDSVLVVLRIPIFNEDNEDIPYVTMPVGIIFTEQIIITVCNKEVELLRRFREGKIRNFSTAKRSRFLLQIFLQTALLYLRYLKDIDNKTSILEEELHKSMRNEELIKLLNIEKSLVFFTTSLRANELMMERLQRSSFIKMDPDDEDLLEDVIIENKQAIEMANIYSSILSGMMDAFASVISNNLNVVMKFLTSVTIILMIPTLIASIYGMNIPLPLQNSPHAFLIIMVLSVVLSILGIHIFRKKELL